MTYLWTSIHRGDRTTALYVFSRRFWECLVTAVAAIVFTIIGFPIFEDRLPLWCGYVAGVSTVLAHVFTRSYRIVATFAFRIHTLAFEEAKAIADGKRRREWYEHVARWFEVNRLAGKDVSCFWWDSHARRCFARTCEFLLRRAQRRPHIGELNCDLPPEQKLKLNEVRDRIEEIPPLAEALFHSDCYHFLIFSKALQISLLLSMGTVVLHLLVTNEPFPAP